MKKAVAILIFFSLFTQCIAHLGIIGYYQLNKDYIAKNLCENRDKPKMKCCGKCYLRKQLKKIDDNDQASKKAPVKIEKNEVIAFILPARILYTAYQFPAATTLQHAAITGSYTPGFPSSVFHPPSAGC